MQNISKYLPFGGNTEELTGKCTKCGKSYPVNLLRLTPETLAFYADLNFFKPVEEIVIPDGVDSSIMLCPSCYKHMMDRRKETKAFMDSLEETMGTCSCCGKPFPVSLLRFTPETLEFYADLDISKPVEDIHIPDDVDSSIHLCPPCYKHMMDDRKKAKETL